MSDKFDVIVIGGGTAGLVTASGCARLGRRVALIEKEKLGGDCLWTGCVPTKALVAAARLADQMRNADRFGLERHEPRITPKSIMNSMRETQRITFKHDAPEKFRGLGVDVIEGSARLVSRNEVQVNGRRLAAKDIVIATGSRTAVPSIEGLDESAFIDHVSFLKRNEFPRSLLIVGGGAIGCEFAQMLRRFGCAVTIVEKGPSILDKEDRDVANRVRELLRSEGVEIHTSWDGRTKDLQFDEIFIASGRRGNIENLGLEAVGVKTDKTYVVADKYLQTSVPRVWACGDVHGGLQFTHVAAYEAVKLVRNMLFPGKSPVDYTHVPWAIYTDPEVAHIGLTEEQVENPRVYKVEFEDVDRAVVDRATKGFLKLICDARGKILGAHVMAANASTLIAPLVLARKKGIRIGELAQLVTPYPSMADAIQRAASIRYEQIGQSWIGSLGRRIAALAQ